MSILPFRQSRAKRFEHVVQPHLDGLYRFAYRLAGQRDDAEDLVQDIMVKLYPRLEELEAVEHPRSWLNRVLYRHFIDQTRKKNRQGDVAASDLVSDGDPSGFLDSFSSGGLDVIGEISQDELRQHISEMLESLSPDQRTLLMLHDGEGWKQEDIAEVLGVPVGTIKSRLHRCRAALRERLQQRMEPSEQRERLGF